MGRIGESGRGLWRSRWAAVLSNGLRVARCTTAACTAATIAVLDTNGNVGSNTSITVGADGLPVISYLDNTNGDLKLARLHHTRLQRCHHYRP